MQGEPNTHARTKTARATSTANAAGVVTIAAIADEWHVIDQVDVSYSGAPTGASLTIAFGGVTKYLAQIERAGIVSVRFDRGLMTGTENEAVVFTTAAGGGSLTSEVNVLYR